jgi:MFS family permease
LTTFRPFKYYSRLSGILYLNCKLVADVRQKVNRWLLVATLFAAVLLVGGSGYNTVPVFLPVLAKHFSWSRVQVSMLPSALAASAGLGYVIVGWLLDRVAARYVMVVGALIAGVAFLAASQAQSFASMICAYLALGVGISGATLIPASLVIANWFEARRGLAMGVVAAGASAGGLVMTVFAVRMIGRWGWRSAYVGLSLPIFVVLVPMLLYAVRNHPNESNEHKIVTSGIELEGLETGEAVRTRTFWMIIIAQFCFSLSVSGVVVHLVAYLTDVGYSSGAAALVMGLIFGLNAVGKIFLGSFADAVGARIALAANFILEAIALLLALRVRNVAVLVFFVPVLGAVLGAPIALVPLLIAESVGLKRFGSVSGLIGIASTLGAILGPVVAGRIFDVTANYANAFVLFSAVAFTGAIATLACTSYRTGQHQAPLPALVTG